ncbi:hypothetical protein GCM10027399_09030 [Curvibacter fontanus]
MTTTQGPASRATLHELWQCLLTALLNKSSKAKPSAEILTLARAFLIDNHYVGPVDTPKVRKQLDKLHELYLKGLIAALSDGAPSASVLAEYRIYREQAQRQQQVLEAAKTMQALPATAPFKTSH